MEGANIWNGACCSCPTCATSCSRTGRNRGMQALLKNAFVVAAFGTAFLAAEAAYSQ